VTTTGGNRLIRVVALAFTSSRSDLRSPSSEFIIHLVHQAKIENFFGLKTALDATALARFIDRCIHNAELTRLRISIPGLGTTSYPLIMAQKKGYFQAEGYDVELIPMTGGLAVKTLMAGEVNLTSAGTLVATMQGAKLRMLMGFLRQLPYDLVAAPEIKRVEDLRGKKVAVDRKRLIGVPQSGKSIR
jgi:ABC-type nitrate/sulfonate/bicarbonate transport system substrate-binding protein